MASSINCIFALVALAVVIQTGAAVEKCWSCSSEQNGVCEHLDNATALTRVNYLRDCRYSESPNSYINTEKRICRKFIYTGEYSRLFWLA
ncbi:uncharacterized protein [Fopius arisanus]|uniref:Protein quiver n=1 Tax=Fopius arisanus TaxID=64838 RepID=A0A9R1UAH6_9HYME|nr:PREDICTED: uncharacterized protein LOC105272978 [Fopius arisanus]